MNETLGVYKARTLVSGEKVFHAPSDAVGEYYLVVNSENGVIKYVPKGEVKIG